MSAVKNLSILLVFSCFSLFLSGCNDDDSGHTLLYAPKAPLINEVSDITATSCSITWNAVPNADGYLLDVLYYPPRSGYGTIPGYNKKKITDPSCVITGLAANSSYGIVLYAKDGRVVSPPSDMEIVTTIP